MLCVNKGSTTNNPYLRTSEIRPYEDTFTYSALPGHEKTVEIVAQSRYMEPVVGPGWAKLNPACYTWVCDSALLVSNPGSGFRAVAKGLQVVDLLGRDYSGEIQKGIPLRLPSDPPL